MNAADKTEETRLHALAAHLNFGALLIRSGRSRGRADTSNLTRVPSSEGASLTRRLIKPGSLFTPIQVRKYDKFPTPEASVLDEGVIPTRRWSPRMR